MRVRVRACMCIDVCRGTRNEIAANGMCACVCAWGGSLMRPAPCCTLAVPRGYNPYKAALYSLNIVITNAFADTGHIQVGTGCRVIHR